MKNFIKTVTNTIKYWFIPLLIGVLFIAIGIYTMRTPLESYVTLSKLFSVAFVISGILEIIFSISNREEMDNWGWTLIFGLINLIIGVLLLLHPEVSIITLPYFVGFLVLFRSIGAVSYSIDLKNFRVLDWGNLLVFGVLGIIFSFILLWNPMFAGLTVVLWTGIALIAAGAYSIYLSFKLKKVKDYPKKISKELKDKFKKIKEELNLELEQNT